MRRFDRNFHPITVVFILVSAVALLPLAGCSKGGGEDTDPSSPVGQHIMQAAGLVGAYKSAHKGQVPSSTEALKTWAESLPKGELEKLKITNLDDVLVSPRDKEPY